MKDFESVKALFDKGMVDPHHSVRNAKEEKIEVHGRYERFSEFTKDYVISYFENSKG